MNIRKMTIKDYDGVYALWMSCAGMGLNDVDDSREGIEKLISRNPETCFVAEENDKIIGAILVGNDGRRGYIYHAAVSPACRRQGVGRQMVETAMEALKACGINKVALVAFARNEEGNRFWEKMGFTVRDDLTYRNRALRDLKVIRT